MAGSAISLQPLTSGPHFNWFFLVELLVCGILTLFFFFYFNRLLATFISYGIRAYTWHYYRVHVDFQALQVSLLGGRVFFKGLRYHGVNETILIQRGYITWNYWLRNVRQLDLKRRKSSRGTPYQSFATRGGCSGSAGVGEQADANEESGDLRAEAPLPCRIIVTLSGLEWFVYNRTPAYDDILSGFHSASDEPRNSETTGRASTSGTSTSRQTSQDNLPTRLNSTTSKSTVGGSLSESQSSREVTPGLSTRGISVEKEDALEAAWIFLQFLPIQVDCTKGAIVAGNETTPSLLTVQFEKSHGSVDASDAGPLDVYRQLFKFNFLRPVVQLRPNPDFHQEQLSTARAINKISYDEAESKSKQSYRLRYQHRKHEAWHAFRNLLPYLQSSVESFHEKWTNTTSTSRTRLAITDKWIGLTRYMDETLETQEGWNNIEYARYSTILECSSLSLTYYWDIPGTVPSPLNDSNYSPSQVSDDINGIAPPEWGMEVKLKNGNINYGPWADRERIKLQNVFFPNTFRSSQTAIQLKPGEIRRSTRFKFVLETTDETTLRIPTREESKDWQWKGRAEALRISSKLKKQKPKRQFRGKNSEKTNASPEIRPFGWLTFRLSEDSTVTYDMDMVASDKGFSNLLRLDLKHCKLSTSVNHALLWESSRQVLTCDLSNPLVWNVLHTWSFNIISHDMQLFLLRDHIFLIIDLVNDWTANSSSDFYTFVPYKYNIRLSFVDLYLYLNVNDSNIINNPSDVDDNTFIVLKVPNLESNVSIPSDNFRAEKSEFAFDVSTRECGVDLAFPLWHTLRTFLRDKQLGQFLNLSINGTYTLVSGANTMLNTLAMEIEAGEPQCYLYGFLIRYFMKIRENYFGENMHFKTLEEFQGASNAAGENKTIQMTTNPAKGHSELDVILNLRIRNPCALLPTNIYENQKCLRLEAASLDIDLRFTSYYMDLQVDLTPTKASLQFILANDELSISETQVIINGVSVYGHRLFGLPPTEPTYVCNWDFQVGEIVGECSANFLRSVGAAVRNLDFTMDDEENAIPPLYPITLHDVTFLRATITSLHISMRVEDAALVISAGMIVLKLDDWSRSQFSKRVSAIIPDVAVSAIDTKSAIRRSHKTIPAKSYALIQTTINLFILFRKANLLDDRRSQQDHMKINDGRTHRTPWLLHDTCSGSLNSTFSPPYMTVPPMPEPVSDDLRTSESSSLLTSHRKFASHESLLLPLSTPSSRHVVQGCNTRDSSVGGRRNLDNQERNAIYAPPPIADVLYERNRDPSDAGEMREDATDVESVHRDSGDFEPSGFWASPHFTLYKIQPDSSLLPDLPSLPGRNETMTGEDMDAENWAENNTAYADFFCQVQPGLQAYCTSDAIPVICSLLEGFQVIDPVDVLDSVQLDVIGDLVKHQKSKRTQPKSVSSFSLKIPSASVVFFNELNCLKGVSPSAIRDKYHLRCRQFKFTFQSKTEKKERDMIRDSREDITIHSTAEHISVGATSGEGSKYQDGSDLSLSLEDIMFWIVNSSKISSHIQVRSIEALNTTKSAIPLAHLVRNSTTLLEDTTSLLQAIPSPDERRRYIAWYIINSATGIPDPLLLTRPAYVLRGLQSHLRLQDSWKIISRLRNIYQNLPLHKQNELKSNMNGTEMQYPSNARELTFHNFNNWRPWDLAHVEKSHVMRILWDLDSDSDSFPTKPVTISCNLRSISMIIGPGSSHFDSTTLDMTTAITFTPGVSKAPWPASESSRNKRSLCIRSQCASSILRIKWEILDYVEKITEAIAKDQDISVKTEICRSADEKKTENLEIHVFLGVDDGGIILDGINLGLTLQGHGLNGSFVSSPGNGNHSEQKSILLSGQGCSSEISNQSRPLMIGKIVEPRFYGSHSLSGQKKHDWKIATSCRGLIYNLQEDPRELLHIASQVLEDQVLYTSSFIQRLDKTMPSRTTNMGLSEPKKSVKDVSESHNYHVALFLDDYQLNFRLLPSLTYSIKGRIARMSGVFDLKNKLDLNFDVKGNRHSFHIVEKEVAQPVSEIDIPPVNGRISGKVSDETTLSFKADLTVERMVLEASALRSLLDVLRRAEVSHYISDCNSSLSDLRVHLKETLTRSEPAPKSPAGSGRPRDITYNVRLTMAGWLVHARAPGLNNRSYSADMNVILGSTQIHLDSSDQHAKFDSPNVQVNISQIGLELIKNEDSRAQNYGNLGFDISFCASTRQNERDQYGRFYEVTSKGFDIQLFAETASLVIDIAAHLQNRIKSLDLSEDMKRLKHLGRIAKARSRGHPSPFSEVNIADLEESYPLAFLQARYAVELSNIQICWITNEKNYLKIGLEPEDLVFSIRQVSLSTSGENSAKLRIQDTQLQIAPKSQERKRRSLNSALMPELVFNVAYSFNNNELRLAFQAAGKAVDISFTTGFILPANIIQKSIASAAERLREANTIWSTSPTQSASQNSLFGKRRLSSLLIDVDFAGAVLTLLGRRFDDQVTRVVAGTFQGKPPSEDKRGKYAQADSTKTASLTSPGVALKVQFGDNGTDDPTLNAELKISPSSNTLAPTVVPLIKQISSSVKESFGDQNDANMSSSSLLQTQKMLEDRSIDATKPESILGRCKLNIGIRICKQEFSLTCRPIARVAATAQFEDIFVTVNTVQSHEQRRFFAILIACNDLRASVKHDYSNETTASFEMQSMIMSLMNSKHVSTTSGISAILKVSPMRTIINAKQLQDILLFREIWVPSDDDEDPSTPEPIPPPITSESQTLMVQRYQQVASTEVFPWNAVISIEELRIQLDLSQTLGKADFVIKKFWVSSKKTSDLEQNLCGGFDVMAIESKGRMSGTVTLDKMRVRTSIQWPNDNSGQTPLIQASVGFGQLQVNASFEYQPFLVADIVAFDFLMYNVRQPSQDRLVSILEGEKVQVFCTTLTASQTLALFQTWQRVVQDKLAAYEASLKETERFSRRKSAMATSSANSPSLPQMTVEDDSEKWPVTLHTDVVVTLKTVNVGAFPSTFFDNQIFKMEALDAQARFTVSLQDNRLHSSLGLTLGQLRVALSGINRPSTVEIKDHSVAEVAARATGSRGGTILKVPRVVASMQTWQSLGSNEIDYIFKSAFEGKVDVGWNYSRISFIRGMWSAHSRALASRLGKPLPRSAVRITGGPKPGASEDDIASPEEPSNRDDEQPQDRPKQQGEDEKITAVVEVPQSKYIYRAMEPPIIETPQLRDMGEATPPLEWIGLNRERLPNVTHQIIIVSLLEIAKEVSDAYGKILG